VLLLVAYIRGAPRIVTFALCKERLNPNTPYKTTMFVWFKLVRLRSSFSRHMINPGLRDCRKLHMCLV